MAPLRGRHRSKDVGRRRGRGQGGKSRTRTEARWPRDWTPEASSGERGGSPERGDTRVLWATERPRRSTLTLKRAQPGDVPGQRRALGTFRQGSTHHPEPRRGKDENRGDFGPPTGAPRSREPWRNAFSLRGNVLSNLGSRERLAQGHVGTMTSSQSYPHVSFLKKVSGDVLQQGRGRGPGKRKGVRSAHTGRGPSYCLPDLTLGCRSVSWRCPVPTHRHGGARAWEGTGRAEAGGNPKTDRRLPWPSKTWGITAKE